MSNYLTTSEVYNTGGGCMVLFMDVDCLFDIEPDNQLKQISYDGESFAGATKRYQESEEGLLAEDYLWYAHSWQQLIDEVGIDLVLEIRKQIIVRWRYTDNCEEREAIESVVKLIDFTSAASQLYDQWHKNIESNCPFPGFENKLIGIFDWQQSVMNKLRK